MEVDDLPRGPGLVDGIENGDHLGRIPGDADIANRMAAVGHAVGQEVGVGKELALFSEIDEPGDAGLAEGQEPAGHQAAILMAWVSTGHQARKERQRVGVEVGERMRRHVGSGG